MSEELAKMLAAETLAWLAAEPKKTYEDAQRENDEAIAQMLAEELERAGGCSILPEPGWDANGSPSEDS